MATLEGAPPHAGIVVVGIDFSELSDGALRLATGMSLRGQGVELHLIHVLPSYDLVGALVDGAPPAPLSLDGLRNRLAALGTSIGPSVKRIVVHVRAGKPDVEIAQLASDVRADLVLVGAHSRHGLRRVLGSVANSLVRNAPCPVLTFYSRSIPLWEKIEPPCPDCIAAQDTGAHLWCARHSLHHPRAHTYSLLPESYGVGAQTFRDGVAGS